MRSASCLILLAGCDFVFGVERNFTRPDFPIESKTHDEDGDGVADALDPCPHYRDLNDNEPDEDDDGIGDRCDPRPSETDTRYFMAFEGGTANLLTPYGLTVAEADALLVGSATGQAQLVFDGFDASIVDMETELEIVDVDVLAENEYAEVGLFSVHRMFEPVMMRGDVCFYGTDLRGGVESTFLEFNNDDRYHSELSVRYPGDPATRGRFRHARTNTTLGCAFESGMTSTANQGMHILPRELAGKVAMSTYSMKVRFHYFWVVTPGP